MNAPLKERLPELPDAMFNLRFGYDAHQMREYGRLCALQAIAAPREGWENCTRSHPHEQMSEACTLRTEIARRDHADAIRDAAAPLAVEATEK